MSIIVPTGIVIGTGVAGTIIVVVGIGTGGAGGVAGDPIRLQGHESWPRLWRGLIFSEVAGSRKQRSLGLSIIDQGGRPCIDAIS
jgi:hypothetical protein